MPAGNSGRDYLQFFLLLLQVDGNRLRGREGLLPSEQLLLKLFIIGGLSCRNVINSRLGEMIMMEMSRLVVVILLQDFLILGRHTAGRGGRHAYRGERGRRRLWRGGQLPLNHLHRREDDGDVHY